MTVDGDGEETARSRVCAFFAARWRYCRMFYLKHRQMSGQFIKIKFSVKQQSTPRSSVKGHSHYARIRA